MKLYIQNIIKMLVIATAFCLTLCCAVIGGIERDLFTFLVGIIGFLITIELVDKGV